MADHTRIGAPNGAECQELSGQTGNVITTLANQGREFLTGAGWRLEQHPSSYKELSGGLTAL